MAAERAEHKEALYAELKPVLHSPKLGVDGEIWSFCPVHESDGTHTRRSLSLSTRYGLRCWAGCEFTAILDALGVARSLREQTTTQRTTEFERQRQRQAWAPLGSPVAVYQYRDSSGNLIAEKARFEPLGAKKTFRFRISADASWGQLAPLTEDELPLYRTEDVAAAARTMPVYYVEGEKAADVCRARGLLAVTHVGGADQDDFGTALQVLAGRHVRLWADNDEAGRRCMARLAARLRDSAQSVTFVTVPIALPEKGDAWDYFEVFGGTVAALEAGIIDRTVTEYLAFDSVRVRQPTPAGAVSFTFSEMEKLARSFEAEVEITVSGSQEPAFTQRINLLSSSQQTELRRSLEGMYGKESAKWTALVNTACAEARRAFLGQELAVRVDAIAPTGMQEMLVDPILPKGAPTVLFADGSSGKTFIALRLGLSVATGYEFVGLPARSGPVLFIDYETDEATFRRRLVRLLSGIGIHEMIPLPFFYWPARGIPLIDQSERIRRFIEQEAISLVIVDSAAAACGGRPEEAEIALRYFSALARFGGVTTLTIAHVNRGGDQEKPLGSSFWHNQPRRTWNADRADDEEATTIDVALTCRKVNDGRKPAPIGLRLDFEDPDGPVTISRFNIRDNAELQSHRPLKRRIWDALAHPCTVEDLSVVFPDENPESIARVLRRGRGVLFSASENLGGRGKSALWARLAERKADIVSA